MASSLYTYIGLAGEDVVIHGEDVNFRGAWSANTSYVEQDAASYNDRWWIAVEDHTGVTPPTSYTTGVPDYWSPLVLVEGNSPLASTSSEIAANNAYAQSQLALQTAWSGTAAAASALALAQTGTNAANSAYSIGVLALNTAWAGTSAAAAAQATADAVTAVVNHGIPGTIAFWASLTQNGTNNAQFTFVNGILASWAA